jgi:outer membrane lipoprotein SlyB
MKQRTFTIISLLMLALGLAGCGSSAIDSVEAANKTADGKQSSGIFGSLLASKETVVVPQGTAVAIRLQHSISSESATSGDSFDFVLAEPLVINGKTVAPEGAAGIGRVVAARKSGRLHNAGYLRLTLASIAVSGEQTPLQSSSLYISGGSYRKRNWAFIGGGTGAGALIGALAGGGKGALIGSAVGAGAGTTAAYATGKKEVGFAAEKRLTFRLAQPLQVELTKS